MWQTSTNAKVINSCPQTKLEGSLQHQQQQQPVSERLSTTVSVGALHPGPVLTRGGISVPPTVTYLPYRVSGSTLTAIGRFQLLARWPGTLSRILSGIQRAAQAST